MRQITPAEVLSLSTMLAGETTALASAKAGLNAISDEQLRTLADSGIVAAQTRIAGLQQFITENVGILGEVH